MVRLRSQFLMLLALTAWAFGLAASDAQAAGSPNLGVTIAPQARVLQGNDASVTITASNPVGEPYGYNVSLRAVLPAGVSYVAGSSSDPPGEPTVLTSAPAAGQTTLLWKNATDLSANSSTSVTFKVTPAPGSYAVGSTFSITGGAYAHTNPRSVPAFGANGVVTGGSFTGSATGSGSSTVAAISITKSEPSPEAELLRGVHDHQTSYTLTYKNNAVQPTSSLVVDDYLPAGLEFLGCGGAGADHTSNAPTNAGSAEEYPGSGPIVVPAVSGCVAPSLVETLSTDPDGAGPLPTAIYTHVRWTGLGTIASGASGTITYAAAIPLRSNTLTFTGGTPATTGLQAANLNNNSGPEVTDEQPLINGAQVSGLYNGTLPVSDQTTNTVTGEDLAVQKSVDQSGLQQALISHWTLTLRASEYRFSTGITVTDTVPDGLCPLDGTVNLAHAPQDPSDAQCDPFPGEAPTTPYTSAIEQTNGTWAVTWSPAANASLTKLGRNATFTITYPTRTRTRYQEGFADDTPILAGDAVSNAVQTNGTQNVICTGGPSDCSSGGTRIDHDGGLSAPVTDTSGASQKAVQPSLIKKVAQSGSNCATATYVTTVPKYLPGDRICWQLRVDFPASLDTKGLTLIDFLPPTAVFDPTLGAGAGEIRTANDTIAGATFDPTTGITPGSPGGTLGWTLPSGGYVVPSQIFERQIATTVTLPPAAAPGDINGNLFKTSTANTPGVSYPLRDQADYQLSIPSLAIAKRITVVNGTTLGAPVQTRTVRGGDVVTFRVRLTNSGDANAEQAEVWDALPAGLSCADVSTISGGGTCAAGLIKWGASPAIGPTVNAGGGTADLTYQVTVPTTVGPTEVLTNTTGVRQYSTPTNLGGRFTYIPSSNIDATQNASANVGPLNDTATLTGQAMTIAKARTSPIDGANNTAGSATIGETVSYTLTLTVPKGETVDHLVFSDPSLPDARQPLVSGSSVALRDGLAVPGTFTLSEAGGTPTLTFPVSYTSGTGADEVFTITFDVKVANVAGNVAAGASLSNQGRVRYDDPNGAAQLTINSSAVTTAMVEPLIGVTKTDSTGGAPVAGGDIVNYTVTVRNGTVGAPGLPANQSVSPAHETTLVDHVPAGVTPVDGANATLADGATNPAGGVWNLAARTLTFTPNATIEAGSTQAFTYPVRVNIPAVGGTSLTNSVDTTTTSLAGTVAGERGGTVGTPSRYWATASDTLNVQLATVTKTADRSTGTVGDRVVYTADVTIPAQVQLFDTTVVDTLPDSIDFDSYTSATCVVGCPPETAPTVQNYTPVVNGSGTTSIAWDFGDLAQTTNPRTIRLVYTGHVRATHRNGGANVVAGQTAINSVVVSSNRTDKVAGFTAGTIPGGFDHSSTPGTTTLTVQEPGVSIDKQIAVGAGAYGNGPVLVHDGDQLHYRIVVRNTGNAPLYDVTVNDTPDTELTGVTLTNGLAQNTDPWTAGNPAMSWQIPGPIAAGATVTLGYDAGLVAITSLVDGQSIQNTATAPTSFGVPSAQRIADGFTYRSYAATPDAVTATVDSPTITLVKTTGAPGNPDSAPAQVGQTFTWRIVVTNTSASETATSLTIHDTLPQDWTYVAGSATFAAGGPIEPTVTTHAAGDDLDWATSLTLAPGASRTLTFQATPLLAAATSTGTGAGNPHVNTATATVLNSVGNAADANGPFAAAADTARAILSVPTLTISKTPDAGAASSGATVPFHVVVTNTGTVPATNVVITDTFPAGGTYTPGTATAAPSAGFSESGASASSATWTITSLAAGASVDITVPTKTSASAPSGTVITNSVSAVADQTPTPVTDTGDVTLTPSADVQASKTAAPNPATAGQNVTYTIGATNNGPSVADSVVLTDVLPSTVQFKSSSFNCSLSGTTVTCTLGNLAPGASGTASITVKVLSGTTTNADNQVTASSATPDPSLPNNTAGVTVPVGTKYDLVMTKTAAQLHMLNGATNTFTLHVDNSGPSDASGVIVSDTLPAGLSYVSDDGGCAVVGQALSCVIGSLTPGSGADVHVVVRGTATGLKTNTANVVATGSATADINLFNNTSSAGMIVDPTADLQLVKTGPATVTAGGQATYTLAITNLGPDAASGVIATDSLPPGTAFVSADAGCTEASGLVTCTVGNIANGATVTRAITLEAPMALADEAITNNANVVGLQGDPQPGNNQSSAITQVGPAADLKVTKTGPASIDQGGNATWTVLVRNLGPSDATGVQVTDTLPAGTTLVGSNPSQGTCTPGAPLVCTLGAVPSGSTAQVQVIASTDRALGGTTIKNTVAVTGNEPDPVTGNNTSEWSTPITTVPFDSANLTVVKTAGASAEWGRSVDYLITVTNKGPASSANTIVTDALNASLRYVSATAGQGTCAEASGIVTCKLGTLTNGQVVKVIVTVVPLKPGKVANVATTQSDNTDVVTSDNKSQSEVTVVQRKTKLALTKVLQQKQLRAGGVATYRVRVANTGSVSATNVRVCDRLPKGLTLRSAGTGTIKNGQLCFTIAKLGKGEARAFDVPVRVSSTIRATSLSNTATATSDNTPAVSAKVTSPLQGVAGTTAGGVTG